LNFSLIVTDSGPLITLAIAGSLDVLFLPNLPVIVPDMVRHEVIQDLSKPGAALVAQWIRLNDPHRLTVAPTEVFEEFMLLRSMNPSTKTKNRGEQAAAEVLGRQLEGQDFGAVLLFEDSAVRKTNFLTRLPDCVVVTSTSEFLFRLESRGLIQNAQSILDQAVDVRGNEILVRYLAGTESSEPVQDWAVRMRPRP
jgi:predicted nucleic acid-binding protein